MTIAGGLRVRLIADSVRTEIIAALTELGWFDPVTVVEGDGGRQHMPLYFRPKPAEWDEDVALNSFSITLEDQHEDPSELGNVAVDDTITFFMDMYAESHVLGQDFASDVEAIVAGRFPTIGRDDNVFDVYDLRMPTPAPFTRVDVERVAQSRAVRQPRSWQRYWYFVRFDVVDEHLDEYDGATDEVETNWSDDLAGAWSQVREALHAAA